MRKPTPVWRGLVDSGVGEHLSEVDRKHVRITNVAAAISALTFLLWVPANLVAGRPGIAAENAVVALLFASVPALNAARRHRTAPSVLLTVANLQCLYVAWTFGGDSGVFAYYATLMAAPYLAYPRSGRRLAHAFALAAALCASIVVASADRLPPRVEVPDLRALSAFNAAAASLSLVVVLAIFARLVDRTEDALHEARARTRALLHNVLPNSIADRLEREPDRVIADRYAEVTVLFADLVGFTPMASAMSPEAVVGRLNHVFRAFDAICAEEGAEKIKTLGDGYMAVCGAPERREDHAEVMVRVARRIAAFIDQDPACSELRVRIGLNSGPAVGGIVGKSRFLFDLWSDTVNVASRMESTGRPGRVQLAEGTWERIRDRVACEPRGVIEVKGKGPMRTWFLA